MRFISSQQPAGPGALSADSQVAEACRQVLRLIQRKGLQPGDSLPTQAELLRLLGLSNNALTPAMEHLSSSGVVARKRRVGTVVVDPHAMREPIWRVGLALNFSPASATPFHGLLASFVQAELAAAGCRVSVYYRQFNNTTLNESLNNYAPLLSDGQHKLLDGVVALGRVNEQQWRAVAKDRPIVSFGTSDSSGATLDSSAMVRQSTMLLASQGCRRLQLVLDVLPSDCPQLAVFREAIQQAGLPEESGQVTLTRWPKPPTMDGATTHVLAGRFAAQQLMKLRASQRPDGLIILDDFTAEGLVTTLQSLGNYRPQIAVLTHRQTPQVYALPVYRYEVDIAEMARHGVIVLKERMLDPGAPSRLEWVTPRLLREQASHFPLRPHEAQYESASGDVKLISLPVTPSDQDRPTRRRSDSIT